MHRVSLAMASYLEAHGGEIRTSAEVDRILVDGSRATGVRLASGEEIGVEKVIAAAADPAQLVLRFLGEEIVGEAVARKMRQYEWGDATLVMYVALDAPVGYAAGYQFEQAAHVHLTPPLISDMAEAMNECRGGLLPRNPLVVAWNDSIIDPSRVPSGKHLKKFVVLGVPYEIKGDAT